MNILITGAGGMLGTDLAAELAKNFSVAGSGRYPAPHLTIAYHVCDLAKVRETLDKVAAVKPDLIFHTAAMTDVDGCEKDPTHALLDNFESTKHLIQAANRCGAGVIFFSTDYVFDGEKQGEYAEGDMPRPINRYGESKLLAESYLRERADHFVIFRISWLFGKHGRSFPRTILERAPSTPRFEVVSDQAGRPTYTRDLAQAFGALLARDPAVFQRHEGETFHLANTGTVSWADFAAFILQAAGYSNEVARVPTAAGYRPAARPKNSVLALEKAERVLALGLRPWQEAARDFVQEWKAENQTVAAS